MNTRLIKRLNFFSNKLLTMQNYYRKRITERETTVSYYRKQKICVGNNKLIKLQSYQCQIVNWLASKNMISGDVNHLQKLTFLKRFGGDLSNYNLKQPSQQAYERRLKTMFQRHHKSGYLKNVIKMSF